MHKKEQSRRSKDFSKKYDYYANNPVKIRVDKTPGIEIASTGSTWTLDPPIEPIEEEEKTPWSVVIILSILGGIGVGLVLTI